MKVLHINENYGVISGIEKYLKCWDEWGREFGITNQIVEFVPPDQSSSEYLLSFFSEQALKLCTGADRAEKANATLKAIAEFDPDLTVFHNFYKQVEQEVIRNGVASAKVIHDNYFLCLRGHGFELLTGKSCYRRLGAQCLIRCGGLGRDQDGRMRFHRLARRKQELRLLNNFSFFLTPSQYMKTQLVKNGVDAGRVHVFPPLLGSAPRTQNGSDDGKTILFCGRIDRGKGIDMLLEAVRHVRQEHRLRIVGAGKDLDKYKRIVQESGLAENTKFLGRLHGEDVENEYGNAAVIAVPSRMPEAFCFSGIEALMWGKPLVAFRCGAIEEWLSDGIVGYAIENGNTQQFGQKLDELLQNRELRERMADAGRKYLETSFSIKGKGQEFADRLQGLVNNHFLRPTHLISRERE